MSLFGSFSAQARIVLAFENPPHIRRCIRRLAHKAPPGIEECSVPSAHGTSQSHHSTRGNQRALAGER